MKTYPLTNSQLRELRNQVESENWFGHFDHTHRKLLATIAAYERAIVELGAEVKIQNFGHCEVKFTAGDVPASFKIGGV
jgi:hypothetical protein